MKLYNVLLTGLVASLLVAPLLAQAYEPDWKRGHVYYRMVCTECHKAKPCGAISPNTRTRAEWIAYMQADKHDKGKESLRHYVSKSYRESVKDSNKAAAKFLDVPDEQLYDDLKAFVSRGSKDGDAPTGCR